LLRDDIPQPKSVSRNLGELSESEMMLPILSRVTPPRAFQKYRKARSAAR
jgi:hypothetical protein